MKLLSDHYSTVLIGTLTVDRLVVTYGTVYCHVTQTCVTLGQAFVDEMSPHNGRRL